MTRNEGKEFAQGSFGITIFLFNKSVSSLFEQLHYVVVNVFFELLVDVVKGSFDYLLGLRDSDLGKFDTGLLLDHLDKVLLFDSVEGDASSFSSGTRSSSRTMDVSLSILGGLNLHDEVDTWDV